MELQGQINYQKRREARIEQLKESAAKLSMAAEAKSKQGWTDLEAIPFGQPILVGHHSERSDRAFRSKAINAIDKAAEMSSNADNLTAKVETMENNTTISNDDPQAIEKLKAKLSKLETQHLKYKEAAKKIRAEGGQVAGYILTNSSANIRNAKKRIEQLTALRSQGTAEPIEGSGWSLTEDATDNRILLAFDQRQSESTTSLIKSYGFHWSPSRDCWCRQITPNARYSARNLAEVLRKSTLI